MQKIRLLNQPEDYKKLGVNQGLVEMWKMEGVTMTVPVLWNGGVLTLY